MPLGRDRLLCMQGISLGESAVWLNWSLEKYFLGKESVSVMLSNHTEKKLRKKKDAFYPLF